MKGYSLFDYNDREVTARYLDPLELVWLATAKRLGITVRRNPEVFSMSDGTGLLELGTRDTLDPDDSPAQMIFHEVAHWIVNGEHTRHERDWGFPVVETVDWREFPALRLQAALADAHGLRTFLAPTSGFRRYYDLIPADPFEPLDDSPEEERTVARAREAHARAHGEPWGAALQGALVATAQLASTVREFLDAYQTEHADDTLPSLWGQDLQPPK